jgi:hypothetical protein
MRASGSLLLLPLSGRAQRPGVQVAIAAASGAGTSVQVTVRYSENDPTVAGRGYRRGFRNESEDRGYTVLQPAGYRPWRPS